MTSEKLRTLVPTASLAALLLVQSCGDPTGAGASVTFTNAGPATLRQGDVFHYTAEARDAAGALVEAPIDWSVEPTSGGFIDSDGTFVGYDPGSPLIIVRAGASADTVQVTVTPRGLSGSFSVVGRGEVLDRFSSDLWVHGNAAYTGTWGSRNSTGTVLFGNVLNVWDISDPANPQPTSTITIDARTINDVKIRSDGTLGLITHEGSGDGLNGVTLIDLTDPLQPSIISRTTTSLEPGVHNAWLEGDYAYVVVDGSSGLRVLDISDPANPQVAASFYGGSRSLHDVYLRDGFAFLSHWNAGLIILDVGNGVAGGSPTNPVEVGRVQTAGGQTHNAWYWPTGGYVFVGEEDFGTPGFMHVVDVSDMANPREVATFVVPDTTPHNFWMDEANEILYIAWYSNGIRALDVSGELIGALDQQGREIAGFLYAQASAAGFPEQTWAPQLHNGLLYLSDLQTGLWVLQPGF